MTTETNFDPDLDRRVEHLEHVEEIATLKANLMRRVDESINGGRGTDQLVDVLAGIAVEVSDLKGHSVPISDLLTIAGAATFSLCFLGSPSIRFVRGGVDEAVGEWVTWHPVTLAGEAWIVAGRFADTFKRVDDRWWFNRMSFTPEIVAPWKEGWGDPRRHAPAAGLTAQA